MTESITGQYRTRTDRHGYTTGRDSTGQDRTGQEMIGMDTVGVDRVVCDSVRQGKFECMHVRVNLNVRALVRMHWLKSQAHGCDDSSASTMNSRRAVDS